MGRKRARHRPTRINCCQDLADKLNIGLNDCFEDGPTSGEEEGTGMKAVFRYKAGVRHGMCRIDLRCLLEHWDEKQCDFLFYRCSNKEMHFVELKKASDWKHAFNQITNTIVHLSKDAVKALDKSKIKGYIIYYHTSPTANTALRDLQFEFERKMKYRKLEFFRNGSEIYID